LATKRLPARPSPSALHSAPSSTTVSGQGVGDQLFLGDRFAGVLDQCDQNVERTTAEAPRLPVVEQYRHAEY
jgi:hypothetical protein